jgi:hypothetical protein
MTRFEPAGQTLILCNRLATMYEHLWKGADLKLEYASMHLQQMSQSLQPPQRTAMTTALQSSGAYIEHDWQRYLYAHFDAFLPCTRSVADIINCCFGHDRNPRMKSWFDGLPVDEQRRRKLFTKQFHVERKSFDDNYLTKARDVSVHRAGYPPLTIAFTGFWGVRHVSNPTIRLSMNEVKPPDGSNMGWLNQSMPLRPNWQDFQIGGRNLFEACQEYVQDATDLVSKARNIANSVHGSSSLADPPA